jgi:hypothetical protein
MVVDLPALGPPTGIRGGVDDMWFNWVTDMGLPGPDRGAGGRYLIVGPGYDGPAPGRRVLRVALRHDARVVVRSSVQG